MNAPRTSGEDAIEAGGEAATSAPAGRAPHAKNQSPLGLRGKILVALYAITTIMAAISSLNASLTWIGEPFPGFFVMRNRVVPSIALEHWSGADGALFQREVVEVNTVPVRYFDDVYAEVAAYPIDTPITYTTRADGEIARHDLRSMVFTGNDFLWFFLPLFFNGLVFTLVGIVVWVLGRPGPPTTAVTLLTLDIGLFCLTAPDLYRAGELFRVHVATEAVVGPALLYIALVFPVPRLVAWRRVIHAGLFVLALGLVGAYEHWLHDPAMYSMLHNLCMALWGVGGVFFIASGVLAYWRSPSPLVRKQLAIIVFGLLVGFAVPAWVMTGSALLGGSATINVAVFTAFLFPLSLAYAVVKHDLFAIDAMLRRGLTYFVLTGIVVLLYALLIFGSGAFLSGADLVRSPVFPLVFSVMTIFLFNPVRDRVQRGVDHFFDRTSHEAQKTLGRASRALVATLDLDVIHGLALDMPCDALRVSRASLWVRKDDDRFVMVRWRGMPPRNRQPLASDDQLIMTLAATEMALTVYEVDDQAESLNEALERLVAELILPIGVGDLVGFLALGGKRSGALYSRDDLDFLRTLANQVAVAVQNAQSYRAVEELNASLERRIAERTAELADANHDLATSVEQLEKTNVELERSHEKLLHAEKMAAVGRLTASIAHEVNTPLGATMNSLQVLGELIDEYERSIGDAEVTNDDHRQIAGELRELTTNLSTWTGKAVSYIRGMKAHTRAGDDEEERHFEIGEVLEEVRRLLAHRAHLASCQLDVRCTGGLDLHGDPGKLARVVTNLVVNALDAYEDNRAQGGIIRVHARLVSAYVELIVEDEAGGIPIEILGRIFDEFFTTKPPGKGTGLGLAMSKDIVRDCFGGTIDARTTPNVGTCFTLRMPRGTRHALRDVDTNVVVDA